MLFTECGWCMFKFPNNLNLLLSDKLKKFIFRTFLNFCKEEQLIAWGPDELSQILTASWHCASNIWMNNNIFQGFWQNKEQNGCLNWLQSWRTFASMPFQPIKPFTPSIISNASHYIFCSPRGQNFFKKYLDFLIHKERPSHALS